MTKETFDVWFEEVNGRMMRLTGMSVYDLGDWTWRDAYENGSTPAEALRDAGEYWEVWEGFPADILA